MCLLSVFCHAVQSRAEENRQWRIANEHMALEISSQGGVISALHSMGVPDNWLASVEQQAGSPRFGHFLCFDRWGDVTADEAARGIPFHGEAGLIRWNCVRRDLRTLVLETQLPIARLQVVRSLRLASDIAVLEIENTFANPTERVRRYNAVEHAMFAPFWLEDDVRLTSNAVRGRMTSDGVPVPDSEFTWPMARFNGQVWDLRETVRIGASVVASLVFPDDAEWGWVCMENRRTGDVLGYVWKTEDYPWLNLFWSSHEGVMLNRAIEPGTTGLHLPMTELEQVPDQLGRQVLLSLAPGEKRTHRCWCFIAKSTAGEKRVQAVEFDGGSVRIVWSGSDTASVDEPTQ